MRSPEHLFGLLAVLLFLLAFWPVTLMLTGLLALAILIGNLYFKQYGCKHCGGHGRLDEYNRELNLSFAGDTCFWCDGTGIVFHNSRKWHRSYHRIGEEIQRLEAYEEKLCTALRNHRRTFRPAPGSGDTLKGHHLRVLENFNEQINSTAVLIDAYHIVRRRIIHYAYDYYLFRLTAKEGALLSEQEMQLEAWLDDGRDLLSDHLFDEEYTSEPWLLLNGPEPSLLSSTRQAVEKATRELRARWEYQHT